MEHGEPGDIITEGEFMALVTKAMNIIRNDAKEDHRRAAKSLGLRQTPAMMAVLQYARSTTPSPNNYCEVAMFIALCRSAWEKRDDILIPHAI